jgi:hypothetical protein
MPTKDELNQDDFFHGEAVMESAIVKGTQYVREPDGTWRYADTWIEVPGARDLTLTERFHPKFVITEAGDGTHQVERVVVAAKDIAENPDLLGWCLLDGLQVPGPDGEVTEVMVPWETWQVRQRVPGEIYAPELSDDKAERELAQAEREYREADRTLAGAAAWRAEVLQRHADKMTRQRAREITNLSIGRIQQLIKEGVDHLDQIDRELLATAELHRPKNRKDLHDLTSQESGVIYPTELIKRRIITLVERGLLDNPRGKEISITPEGRAALVAFGSEERSSETEAD